MRSIAIVDKSRAERDGARSRVILFRLSAFEWHRQL